MALECGTSPALLMHLVRVWEGVAGCPSLMHFDRVRQDVAGPPSLMQLVRVCRVWRGVLASRFMGGRVPELRFEQG